MPSHLRCSLEEDPPERGIALTRVHHRLGPHILNTIALPFCVLILMDRTVAGIFGLVLWLNIGIVDSVAKLEVLQHLLHFLLLRSE
jgi:hypothetical protein